MARRPDIDDDNIEVVTDRSHTIGRVGGDAVRGFAAYDEDGRLIETFPTKSAARSAILAHWRGGDRHG